MKESVIETKMDKNAIYSSANSMLAQNLGDSKAAIKFSDKDEGKIISRLSRTCAFQNGGTTIDLSVTYNMTLIAKDTKYKLTLDPVEWNYNGASYVYPNHVDDMNKCTDKLQKDLAAGIDKASSEKDF